MTLLIKDRVQEITSSGGTGPILLGTSFIAGYVDIGTAIGNGNTTPYVITDTTNNVYEIGVGQYILANTSLLRLQVLASSNANALVNFVAGPKNVFVDVPAAYISLTVRGLNQFASTTSANLASIISDAVGTGPLVFANNAVFVGPTIGVATGTSLTLGTALAIGSGGTNSTATPTAGGIGYGTGTAYAITAVGTSGQVLTSAGAGAPTWSSSISGTTGTFSGQLNSVGMVSYNIDLAGFAYRVVASSVGTQAIVQWVNNAQTVQWTSLVGTNGNLQCTTNMSVTGVLSATSFTGAGTGLAGTAASLSIGGNAAGLSSTLAIASGGTGVTTSTGTGNNVLSTSPTLVTPIISSPTISGNGLVNTSWTTAGRPASPVAGQQGFNATTGFAEYWTGTIWSSYGSITPSSVNYLIVAGGGGAATDVDVGGGGGGGGLITGFQTVVSGSSYTITVGGGGAGGTSSYTPGTGGGGNGSQGGNSSFIGLTAIGGGYGGTRSQPGGNGGSGGGGGDGGAAGGSGTSGQGYNGGTAPAMNSNGGWDEGGGGGAGGAGNSWLPGPGLSSSISGSSVTYAAGGRGNVPSAQPVNSGNGGNSMTAGASGVVIIAYSNIYKLATVSGSVTQTNVGGNYIYTFTGSGTITF